MPASSASSAEGVTSFVLEVLLLLMRFVEQFGNYTGGSCQYHWDQGTQGVR